MTHKKPFIVSIGASAVTLALGGLILLGGLATPPSSTYLTDGPVYKDIGELTSASNAVAHVRVVAVGKSYRVPFDRPVANVAAQRPDGPKASPPPGSMDATQPLEGSARKPSGPPSRFAVVQSQEQQGILKTDITVEVVEAVSGNKLRAGDRLVISQLGGTDERGGHVVAEHNPQLKIGDQEIVFLREARDGGKYDTIGGGQGRFKVTANGSVQPIASESLIARAITGKPASVLKSEVGSVR